MWRIGPGKRSWANECSVAGSVRTPETIRGRSAKQDRLQESLLVQTQVLGPQDIPVNPVFSKCFNTPSGSRCATVVDSVAVRSSRFNTVQQTVGNPGLKTQDLPKGIPVENLVPNQFQRLVEVC
jgi:hypothetical protein